MSMHVPTRCAVWKHAKFFRRHLLVPCRGRQLEAIVEFTIEVSIIDPTTRDPADQNIAGSWGEGRLLKRTVS
jgi:hypothetical protein